MRRNAWAQALRPAAMAIVLVLAGAVAFGQRYGPDQRGEGPGQRERSFGPVGPGQWGPPQGQWGPPPQGQWGPPQGQWGPPQGQWGPPQGQWGPPQGEGGSRGEGGPWSRRGRFSRGDRAGWMQGFLRRLDRNGDGRIDESELDPQGREMLKRMAERAGVEPKLPILIDEFSKSMAERMEQRRPGGGGPPGSGSTAGSPTTVSKEPPKVPGFGASAKPAAVPGFGTASATPSGLRLASSGQATAAESSPPQPEASLAPSRRDLDRFRDLALSNIRRYDKNGNGQLEAHEWAGQRERFKAADGNHDGTITRDEMAGWLAQYSRSQGGGSQGDHRSASASPARSYSAGSPMSYRFRTPTERLPEGLPSWFAQRDVNGDGQVSMAEFATFWSDAKVAEFDQQDANRDGIITPGECLGR